MIDGDTISSLYSGFLEMMNIHMGVKDIICGSIFRGQDGRVKEFQDEKNSIVLGLGRENFGLGTP